MVSPIKLMTLSLADLRILHEVEHGEADAEAKSRSGDILEMHGILTQTQLQKGPALLEHLGVGDDPLFQVLTLADQLALQHLLWSPRDGTPPDPALMAEAAAFGLEQARTPQEFVDYYLVYLELAAKFGDKANTAHKRHAHAERAVHNLLGPLLSALDCPEWLGPVTKDEVAEAVQIWAGSGRALGFQRISTGVREIVRHTRYRDEIGAVAREYVVVYLVMARSLIAAAPPRRRVLGQDGVTSHFPVQAGDLEGEVLLSPQGVISLAKFRRKPNSKDQAGPRSAAA
jgi:hypothetical protein